MLLCRLSTQRAVVKLGARDTERSGGNHPPKHVGTFRGNMSLSPAVHMVSAREAVALLRRTTPTLRRMSMRGLPLLLVAAVTLSACTQDVTSPDLIDPTVTA